MTFELKFQQYPAASWRISFCFAARTSQVFEFLVEIKIRASSVVLVVLVLGSSIAVLGGFNDHSFWKAKGFKGGFGERLVGIWQRYCRVPTVSGTSDIILVGIS